MLAIRCFGHFWSKDLADWRTRDMNGYRLSGAGPADGIKCDLGS